MTELALLRAENASLKQRASTLGMSIQIHDKGAVSVYGLGRFPVTLYMEQWLKLLAMKGDIEGFILRNKPLLKVKGSN